MAGEGKSTTAANLAIACSQLERKVLLVDADMRKPRIHELFGLVQDLGLAQLLKGDKEITDVIVEEVCPRLDVILSGPLPLNPAELLSSKRMSDFLQYASRRYDVTILDAPPVLDVTDAVVMGPKVDGTILVISSGTSRVDVLERATEVMERLGSGLLGVVLNRFDPLQSYGGGYGKRGYGYGYYASASQVRATNGRR
jgi:tyrosine-protein kinase Etk/Wzc